MSSVVKRLIKKVIGSNEIKKSPKFGLRRLKGEDLPGWFTLAECRQLYQLVATTKGSILEIGHFLGRSTACICEAIHDLGEKRTFRSYDLALTTEAEYKEFFDAVHQADMDVPDLFKQLVYDENTTTTQLATKNLQQLGLKEYVELFSGNFKDLDNDTYDFIFCDAVHDPNEIRANLPDIVKRSRSNSIWAFHDMNEENVRTVEKEANCLFVGMAASLGIFVFLGATAR